MSNAKYPLKSPKKWIGALGSFFALSKQYWYRSKHWDDFSPDGSVTPFLSPSNGFASLDYNKKSCGQVIKKCVHGNRCIHQHICNKYSVDFYLWCFLNIKLGTIFLDKKTLTAYFQEHFKIESSLIQTSWIKINLTKSLQNISISYPKYDLISYYCM